MHDAILFTSAMAAVLAVYLAWKLRGRSWREYFSTREGRQALRGIVLAPAAILIVASLMLLPQCARAGTLFNDASVFIGIDNTYRLSPQCAPNPVDARGTSNLGAKLNLWQSDSRRIRVNAKYTHHSCALGLDAHPYDAVGIELEWTVWSR